MKCWVRDSRDHVHVIIAWHVSWQGAALVREYSKSWIISDLLIGLEVDWIIREYPQILSDRYGHGFWVGQQEIKIILQCSFNVLCELIFLVKKMGLGNKCWYFSHRIQCSSTDHETRNRPNHIWFPQEAYKGEIQCTVLPNQICFLSNHSKFHAADLQLLLLSSNQITVVHRK